MDRRSRAQKPGTEARTLIIAPPESVEFYDRKAKKLGQPDWAEYRQFLNEAADGRRAGDPVWTCPFCGYEAPNKILEKKHAKECRTQRKRKAHEGGRSAKQPANAISVNAVQVATKRPRVITAPTPTLKQSSEAAPKARARPLPAPAPSPRWSGYFEQQVEARCGLHALNNLIGEQLFFEDDLTHALETFLEENGDLQDTVSDHVQEGGWYSSEVLATALQTVAMQRYDHVMWTMPLLPVTRAEEIRTAVGVLQHRPGPPAHWIALRGQDGLIFELDSLKSSPRPVTDEEAESLLAMFPASFRVQLV